MSRTFLTVADVAARWRCSEEYVRNLVRIGSLTHMAVMAKGYRFSEADIEAYEQDVLKLGSGMSEEERGAPA